MSSVLVWGTLAALAAVYVPLAILDSRVGLLILLLGTAVQTVVLALVVNPLTGDTGGVATLWKVALALVLVVAWRRSSNPSNLHLPLELLIPLLLFCMVVIVYLVVPAETILAHEVSNPNARLQGAARWLTPVLIAAVGWQLPNVKMDLRRLANGLVWWSALLAAISLVSWFLIPVSTWAELNAAAQGIVSGPSIADVEGLSSYFLGSPTARAVAPFGSPLALAFFLAFPCLLVLRGPRTHLRAAAGVLIVLALLATQTRAIILSLLAVELVHRLPNRWRWPAVILGGPILGYFLIGLFGGPSIDLSDPSAINHQIALQSDWAVFITHPFGLGLGQGGAIGRTVGSGLAGGENLFLVLGNEIGWLGLALGLAVGGSLFYIFRTSIARAESGEAPILEVLRDSLIVYALASLTTEHAVAFISTLPFWLMVGLGLRISVSRRALPPAQALVRQSARAIPSVVTSNLKPVGPR